MKKYFTALVLSALFSICSYAQIRFEKGYFIDNDGNKSECLIKNLDWMNNPTEFDYKINEEDKVQTRTIQDTKEFGVYDVSKYIRFEGNIDKSSNSSNVTDLSNKREPEWKKEKVFLKTVVEGSATLYFYIKGDIRRLFYSMNNSEIHQLIYKRYLSEDNKVLENNDFRRQLSKEMKCDNSDNFDELKKVKYTEKDLKKYFIQYNNECQNISSISYGQKTNREIFNLKITPGINLSNASISIPGMEMNFGNQTNFRIGVEAEFILPFNKNKFSLVAEPVYEYYNSEKKFSKDSYTTKLEYNGISLFVGARYYLFLNENSKLFINAFFVPKVIDMNSKLYVGKWEVNTDSGYNLAFGLGYNYKSLSAEVRYNTKHEFLPDWETEYNRISFILGYKILKVKTGGK